MLPKNHLLELVPNRAHRTILRLQDLIWENPIDLKVEVTEASPDLLSFEQAQKLKRKAAEVKTYWGKLFDQRWCRLHLPRQSGGNYLHWKDEGEATLYINGQPYFGFDPAHTSCQLPKKIESAWIASHCVKSGIWFIPGEGLKHGSFYEGATLLERNEEAWQAYHDLKCLLDWVMDRRKQEFPSEDVRIRPSGLQPGVQMISPILRQALRGLDEAVDELEGEGLTAFSKRVAQLYEHLRSESPAIAAILTGHAHLDLVWLWPERIGETKALHTFSTVNYLMERYPDFRFAYSQPASYEAVKRKSPALIRKIQKRIGEGKWQATGAMYVESDTMLPCGEALLRSFSIGQEAFEDLFGEKSRLTWLPDVFGYSACLPQIMKIGAGVDRFFTTKMSWNALNPFPQSSFIWRGHDGTEVLAHITQKIGYTNKLDPKELRDGGNGHLQSDIHSEFLMPTGYGDGGGGPTEEMCERASRLNSLNGLPEITWDQPEAFFDRLESLRDQLPTYQGECFPEYHRGIFTSHSQIKQLFRQLETTLQVAEAVTAATGKKRDLTTSWKRLIFAQFHDYIPGSSVADVCIEAKRELAELSEKEQSETESLLKSGKATPSPLSAFNPHAVSVRTWLTPGKGRKPIYVELPPLSGTEIDSARVNEEPEPVTVNDSTLSLRNGLAQVQLNKKGWIKKLVLGSETIPFQGPAGQVVTYPDHPAFYDAWDIDRQALALGEICEEPAELSVIKVKSSPFQTGIRVLRSFGKSSSISICYSLKAGSPLLHVDFEIDLQDPEILLKWVLPTEYTAERARFGSPYGSVLRHQISVGRSSEAQWEVPFSRYLALSDEGEARGLFVVTENKYGASVRDGTIGISLVRNPRITGFQQHMANAWPAHLSRLGDVHPFADTGKHRFGMALGSYSLQAPREDQPAMLADTLFTAPVLYEGKPVNAGLKALEGGESLIPAWAKPEGNGEWILRLHEVGGQRGSVTIEALEGWTVEGSRTKKLHFTPYQIVSAQFRKK
ncbi:MAG: glycoside hydrolase family 38 C-terminal domain-containing protein [Verrucomicrobiota bacterium]